MADAEEIAKKYISRRAAEIARLESYVTCEQYQGRVDWFDTTSSVPLFDRAPCINYALVNTAIASHVSFVFGEDHWPALTSSPSENDETFADDWGLDKEDSELLDSWTNVILVKFARLKEVVREALSDAMGAKSVAVVACVRGGRLLAETVKAAWCVPTLNDHNECVQLEIRYPYIETFFNEHTRQEEQRCRIYRRVINDVSDTVYKPGEPNIDGREPSWTVDRTKSCDHGLGFCPVVWYPYLKSCSSVGDVDGRAIHEHQLREIDALNISLSQKHRAAVTAGDPQAVEIGVADDVNPAPMGQASRGAVVDHVDAAGNKVGVFGAVPRQGTFGRRIARKRGAGVIWRYPDPKTKVEYLTISSDSLKAIDEHANDLRNKIAEAFFAILIDPQTLKMHAAMSGKALALLFTRQLGYDDQVRADAGDKLLLPLVSMLLRMVCVVSSKQPKAIRIPGIAKVLPILQKFMQTAGDETGAPTGKLEWLPPRMDPVWPPYFAPNELDQKAVVELVQMAHDAGLCTVTMGVEKLAQAGVFDVGSAAEVVDAINVERTEKLGEAHDAMSALGGGNTDGSSNANPNVSTDLDVGAAHDAKPVAGAPSGAASPPGGGDAGSSSVGASGQRALPAGAHLQTGQHVDSNSVFSQLLEDYKDADIEWVKHVPWTGPVEVPLSSLDFSNKDNWDAADDTEKVDNFADKIANEGFTKPIIVVNNKSSDGKMVIVDGHHRALAYAKLGQNAMAYVGDVGSEHGPWDTMHSHQAGKQVSNQVNGAAGPG